MLYTTSIFLQLFSILSQFQRFRIFYPSISNVAEHRSSVQSLSELERLTQKVLVQT